jgi:hypothetical protein
MVQMWGGGGRDARARSWYLSLGKLRHVAVDTGQDVPTVIEVSNLHPPSRDGVFGDESAPGWDEVALVAARH